MAKITTTWKDLNADDKRKLNVLAKENKNNMREVVKYMRDKNIGTPAEARRLMNLSADKTVNKTKTETSVDKEKQKPSREEKSASNKAAYKLEQEKKEAERLAKKEAERLAKAKAKAEAKAEAERKAKADKPKAEVKTKPKAEVKPEPPTKKRTPVRTSKKPTAAEKKINRRLAMAIETSATEQRQAKKKEAAQKAKDARSRNVGKQNPPKVTGSDLGKFGKNAAKGMGIAGKLLRSGPVGVLATALTIEKTGGGKDTLSAKQIKERDAFEKREASRKRKKYQGDMPSPSGAGTKKSSSRATQKDVNEVKKKTAAAKAKQQKAKLDKLLALAEKDAKALGLKSRATAKNTSVAKTSKQDPVAKRQAELKAHNSRIIMMTPAERKAYRASAAGKSGKLLK